MMCGTVLIAPMKLNAARNAFQSIRAVWDSSGKDDARPGTAVACRISTVISTSNCTTQIMRQSLCVCEVFVMRQCAHLESVGLPLSHVLGSKVADGQVDCTHSNWKPRGNLSQQRNALQKRKQGAKAKSLSTRCQSNRR
jgi:hypothetical protein